MRNVLVVGGLLVVAVGVGLWLLLSNDDSTAAQASPTQQSGSVRGGEPPPLGKANVTAGARPELPQGAPGEKTNNYASGGVVVSDHRGGDKPVDDTPNPHPAEARAIPSTLTHEIAQKVQTVMKDCVASLAKEARGVKPRLEGEIVIAIKSNKLSVTQSSMQLRNISADAVEPTKQCIESKTIGLENPAPDQADLDNYPIHISFAIP